MNHESPSKQHKICVTSIDLLTRSQKNTDVYKHICTNNHTDLTDFCTHQMMPASAEM